MPKFHAHDGWHFERLKDGSVRVTREETQDYKGQPLLNGSVELETVVFDPDTWASIVASVSKKGENGDTFARASRLHMSEF